MLARRVREPAARRIDDDQLRRLRPARHRLATILHPRRDETRLLAEPVFLRVEARVVDRARILLDAEDAVAEARQDQRDLAGAAVEVPGDAVFRRRAGDLL